MMSQNKLLDKIKEQIRFWNITFLITSTFSIAYLVLTSYLEMTKEPFIQTVTMIILMLFCLPLGISMGLHTSLNLLKEYKEEALEKNESICKEK